MSSGKISGVKGFAFVLTCVVCIAASLQISNHKNSVSSKLVQIEPDQDFAQLESSIQQDYTHLSAKSAIENDTLGPEEATGVSVRPDWLTEPNMHAISEFQISRGHFNSADVADYHAYDLETLSELARSNDFIAVHVLAEKLHESGKREEAYSIYEYAAALGSTAALGRMAGFHNSTYFLHADNASEEEQSEMLVQTLSLYKVAEIRGDRSIVIDANAFLESTGHTLSTDQSEEIDRRARKLYKALDSYRDRLGLDEFDNSVPEHVAKYYDSMYERSLY